MRRTILLTGLIFAAGGIASAAMPYFNNSGDASAAPQAKSGWKLPSLWPKSKPAPPEPQFFYQHPTPPPSATQRFGAAITNNPVTNTVGGWMTPANAQVPSKAPQQDDILSLNRSVEKPTPELFVSMAQVRETQGDTEGARALYQQALAAGTPSTKTLREIGHFEDRQGRLADAERYYQQAVVGAPENTGALNDLALCLARQGKLEPSAEVLHRAIRLAPEKPLYRNNMATVLMELGEQQDAMLHLMAAHPPATAFFNMGHLLEKGGKLPAAAAHYAEATRLDPTMQAAHEALARTNLVPQTAMAPQNPPARAQMPQGQSTVAPAAGEPSFGPKLLPPTE